MHGTVYRSRNAERAMSRTDWMLVLAMAAPYLLLATIVGLIVLTG
jgi:type III secretory pathway component EscS